MQKTNDICLIQTRLEIKTESFPHQIVFPPKYSGRGYSITRRSSKPAFPTILHQADCTNEQHYWYYHVNNNDSKSHVSICVPLFKLTWLIFSGLVQAWLWGINMCKPFLLLGVLSSFYQPVGAAVNKYWYIRGYWGGGGINLQYTGITPRGSTAAASSHPLAPIKQNSAFLLSPCSLVTELTLFASSPFNEGGGDSSVVRAPDSWLKGLGFESLLERRENFLLQGRLSVLTLIFSIRSTPVLPQ